MTPVETLREAARLMRERAEAATPGPWDADRNAVRTGRDALALTYSDNRLRARPNAAHIAAMHPGVALAVADWLDHEADLPFQYPVALAVARAYLGDD